jgi:LmbE family N-acetylglucosaminyl deacetylase
MIRFLLASLLLFAISADARVRTVRSPIDTARSIVIVTAHPDDELLLAPLLARRCKTGGATCTIIVMTTGNAEGLGETRTIEMQRAAELLNLELVQWNFSDVMVDVDARWPSEGGGREVLVARIREAIGGADLVLTFDPQHGTTCHPAHRAVASLVRDTGAQKLYFLETTARFVENGFVLANGGGAIASVFFAGDDWQYAIRDAEIHATQFNAAQVESLRTLPEEQRRVWFQPASFPSATRCE